MIEEKDVLVSVRDGARMAVRIYRPDGPGPFPTLFASSAYRYDNNILPASPMFLWRETGPIEWHVEQGYAYVHADARGTGFSEGEYEFFGRREQHDLYDISEQFARTEEERTHGIQPRYAIVTKGWLRASHQEIDPKRSTREIPFYTHKKMTLLSPGKIYKIEIPLQPIAYRFRKGSRIRLEIANGDSPVTDNLFFHSYRPDKIGTDTIYHNTEHPSKLVLPVLNAA